MLLVASLAAGSVIAAHAAPARSSQRTPQSTLQGTVRAVGSLEPLAGATVALAALGRGVNTDPHGYFVLSGIPEGRWTVEARALGYESLSLTVLSAGAGTIRLDFELELRPVVLPGVEARVRCGEENAAVPPPSLAGPAASRVQGAELRVVPGLAEPDVLRGLQALPSVAAISDFSSALYVRGGSADQNLITLDGIPLFNPYHLGGIFSAIGMDAVSTVELWPGALPAQAGDRLSSTVAIHTRSGGQDRVRASGAVGLISTHLTLDGPLPGRRGSFLFTGRRTYLDAITDAAYALQMISNTLPYGFSDGYLKATHPVGEFGSVAVSAYLNREGIHLPARMREELNGDVDFRWGSKMLSISYRQPLGGDVLLHTRLGYTDFTGTFDLWEWDGPGHTICWPTDPTCTGHWIPPDTSHQLFGRTTARDLIAGADLTWYRRAHTLRSGVQFDAYAFDHLLDNFGEIEQHLHIDLADDARLSTLAAYLEDEWRATERFSLRAGLRFLAAGPNGSAWLPRVGARFRLSPALSLTFGVGRYAQVLRSMRDEESGVASLIAYDILTAQPASAPLATGEDLVLGGGWTGEKTTLRIDAYARRLDGLVLGEFTDEPFEIPPLIVDRYRIGRGTARGVEVQASHRLGRADLSLAYALSFFGREVEGLSFPPRFERRHLVDAGALVPWGERGLLSGRLVVGSGQPATPVVGYTDPKRFDPAEGRWGDLGGGFLLGEHNSARLPGYLRLDVAARKSFQKNWFGREITLAPYLQILNVLNTRNPLFMKSGSDFGSAPQLPILPTFGVEWKF
jgi:outer membrane receptor protein involved in Fe transport